MQSSRPPPPQGPPPSYAFVTRVYRKTLRPPVLLTAFIGGLWALFSAIGWFRNYGVDKNQHFTSIANLSVALGAVYLAVAFIGLFGMIAAGLQRTPLVRIYAYLTVFASLIVTGASLARVVTHFIWKNDLITECTDLTEGQEVVYYGFWGPVHHETIDKDDAQDWCNSSWKHDSWAEIVALLILIVLAALFTAIAFSYLRQIMDPSSPANSSRAPFNQDRFGNFPNHYNPPYNAGASSYGGYAPPAGPPPGMHDPERDDPFVAPPYDGKPPGYTGGDRGFDVDTKDTKDPFADGPSGLAREPEERDVTSRPGPGGPERF